MKRPLFLRLPLLVLATAALHVPPATAGPDGSQEHYERAVRLYLSEQYDAALTEFQAAYSAKQLAHLLIEIGQSYRKLGRPKEALDSYNAFLEAEPSPGPQIKQKVDDYIRQTRAMIEGAAPSGATAKAPAARTDRAKDHGKPEYPTRFLRVASGVTADLHAIAGRAPDDLWAAGDGGTLLHYDGKRWTPSYQGWGGVLSHVTGSRSDDVWAVGEKGLCMHFDGNAWHVAPSLGEAGVAGVWVNGPGDAWAVDQSGVVQHLEGTDWFEPPLSGDRFEGLALAAVATITSSGARWMVGRGGAIARWDGKTLVKVLSGTRNALSSIWQGAPDDAWVVGEAGTLLHHDGKSWKAAVSPTRLALFAVWGAGPHDVWAAGGSWEDRGDGADHDQGVILHYDGKAWSVTADALPAALQALWGTGPRDVFAVGSEGAIYHYDGDAWTEMPQRTRSTLRGLWGASAKDVWAVGDDGVVLHYDGRTWSTRWSRPRADFQAVWEAAPDDVWAVSKYGTILHRDAGGWSVTESGTTQSLRAVWASGPSDAWAAGDHGVLLHWDGAAWSARKSGVEKDLTALWGAGPGDVWAGGERTVLLHYDGRAWSATPNPLPGEYNLPTVTSIWGATASDVWAVGGVWLHPGTDRAILLHYDGTRWTDQPSSPRTHLDAVVGSGSRDVWVVGGTNDDGCPADRGRHAKDCPALILHYDGKVWHAENGTHASLTGVWSGGGGVWAVGANGAVLTLRSSRTRSSR